MATPDRVSLFNTDKERNPFTSSLLTHDGNTKFKEILRKVNRILASQQQGLGSLLVGNKTMLRTEQNCVIQVTSHKMCLIQSRYQSCYQYCPVVTRRITVEKFPGGPKSIFPDTICKLSVKRSTGHLELQTTSITILSIVNF